MERRLGALLTMAAIAAWTAPAWATRINVVGVFGDRALVSVDGGEPRTMRVGQVAGTARLLEVQGNAATFEIDGQRRVLTLGQYGAAAASGENAKVVLRAAQGGHFFADAIVNSGSMRLMVDTGATAVAISAADARRLGIDYQAAPTGRVNTANGARTVWKVKLDTVKIGDITMNGVDAMVLEGGLAMPLLGMSFLSRTNMNQRGDTLTLTKRY